MPRCRSLYRNTEMHPTFQMPAFLSCCVLLLFFICVALPAPGHTLSLDLCNGGKIPSLTPYSGHINTQADGSLSWSPVHLATPSHNGPAPSLPGTGFSTIVSDGAFLARLKEFNACAQRYEPCGTTAAIVQVHPEAQHPRFLDVLSSLHATDIHLLGICTPRLDA